MINAASTLKYRLSFAFSIASAMYGVEGQNAWEAGSSNGLVAGRF
jgi:hypothetical protein